jgi:cardiolipin synthase (CMP-forming)
LCVAVGMMDLERPESRGPPARDDGTWRSLVSALVWGTRGRRFKSGRPDQPAGSDRRVSNPEMSRADDIELRAHRIATVPNILSLLRLASVPFFVWLFVAGQEEAAVFLYAVGAWTDFFDGYIARRTGAITELGKLLDPLADRVFILTLAITLLVTDALSLWLAVVIISREILVFLLWPVLERRGLARIPVNFTGKSATAALLFGLTALAWSETTWSLQQSADELGFLFVLFGAALSWLATGLYAREIARLVRMRSGVAVEPEGKQ